MIGRGAVATAFAFAFVAAPLRSDDTLSFVVADRAYGVSDGLPAAQVLCLYEDRAGEMWVGTTAGLARLGGQEIRVFGLADGLPRNVIYAIQEDADGALFVGTLGGIARYDGKAFRPESGPAGETLRVRSLATGPGGSLYALLGRDTILRRRAGKWESLKLPPGLSFESVAMAVDDQDGLWVATLGDGLLHLAVQERESTLRLESRYGAAQGFPHDAAYFVIADGAGVAATAEDAVLRIGPAGVRRVPLPPEFASGHRALARSADETLYVGTDAGVARVDGSGITAIRSSRGLVRSAVVRLLVDRAQNLWMGTVNRGLALLLFGPGVSYLRLGDSDLRGIDCDADSFCWTATDRDLYRFRLNARGAPSEPVRVAHEGIESGPLFGFEPGPGDDILVTTTNGVGVLDAASRRGAHPILRRDRRFSALRDTFVAALRRDRAGTWWAQTNRGLFSLSPDRADATPVRLANLPTEMGLALTIDGSDAVWLSDHKGALWRLSPGPDRRADPVSLGRGAGGPVDQLSTSAQGDVLVSFEDGGWGIVDPATQRLRTRVPAASELGRVAFESLVTLPDGRTIAAHSGNRLSVVGLDPPHVEVPLLSSADLDGADFRYLSARVMKGGLWLATLGAVARLDRVRSLPPPSPLVVTSVAVENAAAGSTLDTPRLGPRPNAIDMVLSLAEPLAPRQVRYRWRLGGETNRWSGWTSDPRVRISNLEGGAFTFEAQARDRFGRDVSPGVRLPIDVEPLYWESWPFRAVLVALLAVVGYAALRWRVRSLEHDRQRLEEAVAARSTELATANRDLREASLTDPLTSLRNRRYFDFVIEDAANRAQRAHSGGPGDPKPKNPDLIFYLADLDRFKEVNDTYGHQAGDKVLIETARRLVSVVRKSDLVIRWGGEEFLVVSAEARREEGEVVALRVLRAIGETPFDLGDGRSIRRTCSLGWAPFPWRPEAPGAVPHSEVLALADRALYRAKEARNQAVGMLPDPGSGPGPDPPLRLVLTPGPPPGRAPGVS